MTYSYMRLNVRRGRYGSAFISDFILCRATFSVFTKRLQKRETSKQSWDQVYHTSAEVAGVSTLRITIMIISQEKEAHWKWQVPHASFGGVDRRVRWVDLLSDKLLPDRRKLIRYGMLCHSYLIHTRRMLGGGRNNLFLPVPPIILDHLLDRQTGIAST